jgi:hypothetical protein
MKTAIVLIMLIAACFGYPMVRESADGQCDALEKMVIRLTSVSDITANLVQGLSHGKMAELAVRRRYPDLPPSLACTYFYWKATADPAGLQQDMMRRPQ